jgi:catechol 2,3-dioxygenase-like lactoylglutathione lyase family enzyme
MSYVALATDRFEEVSHFYGELLGIPVVEHWDRTNARGMRLDIGDMQLEILDNAREYPRLELGKTFNRVHIVVEVEDIDQARESIKVDAPAIQDTSWGARLFLVHDPDGISITYLQWTGTQ